LALVKPCLSAVLALTLLATSVAAAAAKDERHYQRQYCAGMELEHRLPSGGRIDCLSSEYAIEVDYADKWAEAIGPSLYYAGSTQRSVRRLEHTLKVSAEATSTDWRRRCAWSTDQ
jgi:hypothetical protein